MGGPIGPRGPPIMNGGSPPIGGPPKGGIPVNDTITLAPLGMYFDFGWEASINFGDGPSSSGRFGLGVTQIRVVNIIENN